MDDEHCAIWLSIEDWAFATCDYPLFLTVQEKLYGENYER